MHTTVRKCSDDTDNASYFVKQIRSLAKGLWLITSTYQFFLPNVLKLSTQITWMLGPILPSAKRLLVWPDYYTERSGTRGTTVWSNFWGAQFLRIDLPKVFAARLGVWWIKWRPGPQRDDCRSVSCWERLGRQAKAFVSIQSCAAII